METILFAALSGLGTAERVVRRKADREKDNAKARKLLKTAAAIKAAAEAINSLLADEAFQ